jgi:hypothetical protein
MSAARSLARLALLPVALGCQPPSSGSLPSPPTSSATAEPASPKWLDDNCEQHQCEQVAPRNLGQNPTILKGAAVDILDFTSPCRLDASWPMDDASRSMFHATIELKAGTLFPLRDGLAALYYTQPLNLGPGAHPAGAMLLLEPDTMGLPPLTPGDVFIPLHGEARVGPDLYTHARLEQAGPGTAASVAIEFHAPHFRDGVAPASTGSYDGLHVGDAFRWGSLRARVVRIVGPGGGSDGWVEIGLGE